MASRGLRLAGSVALLLALVLLAPKAAGQRATVPVGGATFDAAGAHIGRGLTLRLAALGRGDALAAVDAVVPDDDGTQVTYPHPGVIEWYRREGGGMEQGVTLATPPPGAGLLALDIATPGAATVVNAAGTAAVAVLPGGQRWRYDGLRVTDATERVLPASLTMTAGGVRITLADAEAVYPLTVDPLIAPQTLTDPGGAVNDFFGQSVAASGDGGTVVVGASGASNFQGVAFVYTRSDTGYGAPQTLTDPGGRGIDLFGQTVAVSRDGGMLVVGAVGTNGVQGTAYVYTRSDTGFGLVQTLTDPGAMANDRFGNGVAMSGDSGTLVVGTLNTNSGQATAYVYTRNGTGFGLVQTLTAPGALIAQADPVNFVLGVSGDGGTLVMGALNTNNAQGAAYVYTRSDMGFGLAQTLTDPGGAQDDRFGIAVTVSEDGSTLVVGAPGASRNGVAYIYTRNDTGFGLVQTLTAPDAGRTRSFGFALAVSGDGGTLAVGTSVTGPLGDTAYVFTKSDTGFGTPQTLTAPGTAFGDFFGRTVRVSGDGGTLVVGASGASNGQGRAYVFSNPPASSP